MQIAYVSSSESSSPDFTNNYAKFCFLWYDRVVFMDHDKAIKSIIEKENLSKKLRNDLTDVALSFDAFLSQQKMPDYIEDDALRGKFSSFGKKLHDKTEELWALEQVPITLLEDHIPDREVRRMADHGPIGMNSWKDHDEIALHQQKKIREKIAFGQERYNTPFRNIHSWAVLNQKFDCEFIGDQFSQAGIELVMKEVEVLASNANGEKDLNLGVEQVLRLKVPLLKEMSWERVVELKKTGGFDALRTKATHLYTVHGKDPEKAVEGLNDEILAATDLFIGMAEPQVQAIHFKAIVTVLTAPVPYLGNFLDVFSDAKEVHKEEKRERDLRWYFTLRELGGANLKVAD